MSDIISYGEVEERILTIQGQQVLIDRDVAELYSVETKEVNQAVRNNRDKFPDGYTIALDGEEKSELVKNFDRFSTLKHSTAMPTAFTEKGLYMLATILKSQRATETTIAIVEAFANLRELSKVMSQLPVVQDDAQQQTLMLRGSDILRQLVGNDEMVISGDETTLELSLPGIKLKRTVKREKRKQQGSARG